MPSKNTKIEYVVLESLEDFQIENYNKEKDTVVKFKNSGHVFTFGKVDAVLDDENTLHGCSVYDINLFSWVIAFGDGNAINKGHGPAVTFGKGNAYSLYQSITYGDGHALSEVTFSYYNCFNSKFENKNDYKFYAEYVKFLLKFDELSFSETYGRGKSKCFRTLEINHGKSISEHHGLRSNHGYSHNTPVHGDVWEAPDRVCKLRIDYMYLDIKVWSTGKVDVFNGPPSQEYEYNYNFWDYGNNNFKPKMSSKLLIKDLFNKGLLKLELKC